MAKSSGRKNSTKTSPLLPIPLAIAAAIVSGCLIFLSFPTFDLFPLSFVAIAFLLLAVRGRQFAPAFWLGLLAGTVCNFGGFYWISYMLREFAHMNEWLAWVIAFLMAVVQGLIYAISTGLSAQVTARFSKLPWILVFPIVFTAVEYAFPLIFPWYLANGQQHFTALIQMADITGAAGITFLIILVNVAIAEIAASRLAGTRFPIGSVLLASVAFIAAISYGMFRISQVDEKIANAPKIKIGMVEANVGIWEKEARNPDGSPLDGAGQMAMLYANLLKHQYLSRDLELKHHPDLIVWPESSYFPLYQVYTRRSPHSLLAVTTGGSVYGVSRHGITPEPVKAFMETGLSAISARNEESILAVGPRGAIHYFNGRDWVREESGTDRNLNAVAWSIDGETAMAVGDNGVILLRQESGNDKQPKWKILKTGRFKTLKGVVHTPKFGWVACGEGGTLISIQKDVASDLTPAGMADLTAVAWSDEIGLVAVGHLGSVIRISGLNEVRLEQPTKKTLRAVWAGSRIWAAGDDGELLVCDTTCNRVRSGVRRNLHAVASHSSDGAIVAGDDGTVVEITMDRGTRVIPGARGRIVGLTEVPFVEGYPYPTDARKIYVSRSPLPADGSPDDPLAGYRNDRETSAVEKNTVMRGFSTPMIYGAATIERYPPKGRKPRMHNTAMMIDGNGEVLGTYFKNRLLIFGEFIPLENIFPFVRKWLPEAGDWTPGEGPAVFTLDDARIGISICYEGLLAGFHKKLASLEPNILVNITNDAWFGPTHEPWLHLQLAELRTVETRTAMVRSTNTGISAFIDPVGRRLQNTKGDGPVYLVRDMPLTSEKTFYVRYGDLFAWACCLLAAILVIVAAASRRRRRSA